MSILPITSSKEQRPLATRDDMRWYNWWVRQQVRNCEGELFSALRGYNGDSHLDWFPRFVKVWEKTSKYMKSDQSPCIDGLVALLADEGSIILGDGRDGLSAARLLVFAIIGWQTMLYRTQLGNCPHGQLSIVDEMEGYQGQGQIVLRQDQASCKRHMYQLLMGFGVLLPPVHFTACESAEEKRAFNLLKTTEAASINAFLLTSIGGITIKWIDCLAHHLELDPTTQTLYLFRYPSFCLANIPQSTWEEHRKSVIHACAAPDIDSKQWATPDEVTQMLRETLLSYRLLFGQAKEARQLFRKLNPFTRIPEEGRDRLLGELCGRKRCQVIDSCSDRETYDLERDFPMFRSRLATLQLYLSLRKPRTWKELWQDKRDSAQWFTFWAVLILGGLGLLLALFQVILQIVQIAQTKG